MRAPVRHLDEPTQHRVVGVREPPDVTAVSPVRKPVTATPAAAVCQHLPMSSRSLARIVGVAVAIGGALSSAPLNSPTAAADPCSDVAVVFARGTHQEPGLGNIGQAFVDSLTARLNGRSVDVYPVNYPGNDDYHASVANGSDDAGAHIQNTVASCPDTRIVLGGYSQGAAVIDSASTAMPGSVADHVAAVVLFGEPSSGLSTSLYGGQPLPTISPLYSSKTLSLCAQEDPICTGGGNLLAHVSYIETGMTDQGATFAANRIGPTPDADLKRVTHPAGR